MIFNENICAFWYFLEIYFAFSRFLSINEICALQSINHVCYHAAAEATPVVVKNSVLPLGHRALRLGEFGFRAVRGKPERNLLLGLAVAEFCGACKAFVGLKTYPVEVFNPTRARVKRAFVAVGYV